jgi:uncharacterized protein (TIGR03089 family)
MDTYASPTIIAIVDAYRGTNPARPLLTYYDDATGERTELSVATLANWIDKTANLIVDGHGLGPGDLARVILPPHWQTAAVLLGCWSAGLAVDLGPAGRPADLAFIGAAELDPLDRSTGVRADELYALALAPMAAPFRPGPPAGTLDYVIEVRAHGDHFTPAVPVRPDTVALGDGTSHGDLVAAARARGVPAGARVLIDAAVRPDPRDWLLAPLVAGASVVLCAHLDPTRLAGRLAAEHAVALDQP